MASPSPAPAAPASSATCAASRRSGATVRPSPSRAASARMRRAGCSGGVSRLGAPGDGEQHRIAAEAPREIGQRLQRRRVRPVQVVDEEHPWLLPRDGREQRASDPVQEPGLRPGIVERRGGWCAELGHDPRRLGGRGGFDRLLIAFVHRASDELHRRAEGQARLVLEAAHADCDCAACARPGEQLLAESRLADPRLALDRDQEAVGPDRRVGLAKGLPFAGAADERVLGALLRLPGSERDLRALAHLALEDPAVERRRALGRADAELPVQHSHAVAVLRDRGVALAAECVQLDQAPVGRLVEQIEGEPAPGMLDCGSRLAERRAAVSGPIEKRPELARQRSRPERLPGVEGRAVAKPETGEEWTAMERRRRFDPLESAGGRESAGLPRRPARHRLDRARPSRGRRPPTGRRAPRGASKACAGVLPGRARRRSRARAVRRASRGCGCRLRSPGRRAARWPCGCRPRAAHRPPRPTQCRGTGVADPPVPS